MSLIASMCFNLHKMHARMRTSVIHQIPEIGKVTLEGSWYTYAARSSVCFYFEVELVVFGLKDME